MQILKLAIVPCIRLYCIEADFCHGFMNAVKENRDQIEAVWRD